MLYIWRVKESPGFMTVLPKVNGHNKVLLLNDIAALTDSVFTPFIESPHVAI